MPKNTLVRYTLRDIHARQQEQMHLAAVAAAAAAAEEEGVESPRSPRAATKCVAWLACAVRPYVCVQLDPVCWCGIACAVRPCVVSVCS